MRIRWILIGITVLIAVALLAPAFSYFAQGKGKGDIGLELSVSAYKSSLTDSNAKYTANLTKIDKLGYVSYIGEWWGGLVKPAQTEIVYPRVGVTVVIVHPESDGQWRESHEYGYSYDYGKSFHQSYKYNAFSGSTVDIWVRIYDGYGIFTELVKHYVVE